MKIKMAVKWMIQTGVVLTMLLILFFSLILVTNFRGGRNYIFYNESYLLHVFHVNKAILNDQSPLFNKITFDRKYTDHSRQFPKFISWDKRLTIATTKKGMEKYRELMAGYFEIKARYKYDEDELATRLRGYIHHWFLKKQKWEKIPKSFSLKPFDPIENGVYMFASHMTACGRNAITLQSLLRDSHIPTRIIIISFDSSHLVANHVTLEYYSKKHKQWVLLDPTVNTTLISGQKVLSAFQYQKYLSQIDPKDGQTNFNKFKNIIQLAIDNELAKTNPDKSYIKQEKSRLAALHYFAPVNILAYANQGPITRKYFFSASENTIDKLKRASQFRSNVRI
jgi:hypothetical protein